ncbi:universal stress protein [Specibacter sp. RAF43]|uniref:universal stress protein n=1 Tax=Specibacter sp. RAF43 TaxID=3233057 RepID=UPI003F9BEEA1
MAKDNGAARIVVGVDGSVESIAALRAARRMAGATGARVEAVACWSVPTAVALPYALGSLNLEEGARELLDETMVAAFGVDLPKNVSTRLVQGLPRPTLIAASDGAEMLVVGRRGRGGFAGLLLGSVSSACVAHARCPVLVVPRDALADEDAGTDPGGR